MRLAAFLMLMAASDPAVLLRQALAEHERGQLAEAVRDYRQLLVLRPDLTKARVNLAAALGELGQFDEAISVYRSLPAAERSDPQIRGNLGLALYRKGDFAAAAAEFEGVLAARPADLPLRQMLADCYLRSGSAPKAAAVLEAAARANPVNAHLNYQYGMALIRSGRTREGLEPVERAAAQANLAEAYLLAGATALDLAQFARARQDLEAALRLDPRLPGAYTWTGLARDRLSDEEGAKLAFRKALELHADDFEANLHLGAILYRERELTEARPYLEKALHLEPSSLLARYAMALVRSSTGEPEQAVRDLELIVQEAPDWVEAHTKLATLYFRLRREADGHRERAIVDRLRSEHREGTHSFPTLEGPGQQ